ncbi:MAG: LTA synthase family protein, partial [Myxococcota bacterium]
ALESLPSFGDARGANALVVQIEALQSWVIEADIDGKPVMPFLRSLRTKNQDLGSLLDQTGDSPTSDCEYLVLNSLLPLERGSVAFRRPGNDFVALPKVLREAGYSTLSAHGYTRGMWNRAVLHPRYGFDNSYFLDDLPPEPKLGWGMGDKPFFGHAIDLLRDSQQPFFAFFITLTSHHPYHYLPPEERTLDAAGLPPVMGDYLASMRYVDEALQGLFEGLREHRLLENTLVMLYGDHDAKLRWSSKSAAVAAPRLGIEQESLTRIGRREWTVDRVPALIVMPSTHATPTDDVETFGGQIDLGPTLLHHLGIRAPAAWLGSPLVPQRSGWVFRGDGAGGDDVFDVPPAGGPAACRRRDGGALSEMDRLGCGRLVEAISAHRKASASITLHNLAHSVSSKPVTSPFAPP